MTTESYVPNVEERISLAFAQAGVINRGAVWGNPPEGFFFSVDEAQKDIIRQLSERCDQEGGNAVIAINFQHDLETTALGAATMIYAQGTVVRVSS